MKHAPNVAGVLLGLLFVFASLVFFFDLGPKQKIPDGSPVLMFMNAFGPTGYMTFVKVLELIGGILVAIPRTRNFGLLILGPILVNILAFHIFVARSAGDAPWMLVVIVLLAGYLLFAGRKNFAALAN